VKNVKLFLIVALMLLFAVPSLKLNAQEAKQDGEVNLIAEFSLFYEYYKTKDYESAEPHGWIVLDKAPKKFLKYRPYKKMETIIYYMHDSVATTPEQKEEYFNKAIKLYDKAVEAGAKNPEYFVMRKAYVIEKWSDKPPEEKIQAYVDALAKYPDADPFYKDRLGMLYAKYATEDNDYKMKALEIYMKLSDEDPENDLWIQKINSLAEDMEQLVEFMKKAWDHDKENMEKAWKYAEMCGKAEMYDKAIEPLEFLVKKNPDVITYWKKLASLYQKVGRTDDAIKAYKTLIKLDPKNRDNYFNIAIIYKKIGQLSVARSYLQKAYKASEEPWDMPIYVEAQLYEQAASQSGTFDFMDKCVYKLAVDTYVKAARIGGPMASAAVERVKALENTIPQKEDYFFRKYKSGDVIKIEGGPYGWIKRSITVK
jgi:tetratricopeptide (TPR) repeat protein